jgi:hypothetical protein
MQTIMFVFLWVQVIVVFPRQPVSISLYFFCDKIHIFFQVSQISAEVEVRFLTVLLISFNLLSLWQQDTVSGSKGEFPFEKCIP